jgi:hypothetical protein
MILAGCDSLGRLGRCLGHGRTRSQQSCLMWRAFSGFDSRRITYRIPSSESMVGCYCTGECAPLLAVNGKQVGDDEISDKPTFVQLLTPGVSLAVSTVGAGILSFPFATAGMGLGLCVVFTTFFATLNGITDCILAEFVRKLSVRTGDRVGPPLTFEQLCFLVIPKFHRLAQAVVFLGSYGAALGMAFSSVIPSPPTAPIAPTPASRALLCVSDPTIRLHDYYR